MLTPGAFDPLALAELEPYLSRRDLTFICSGTHPFSDWAKQQINAYVAGIMINEHGNSSPMLSAINNSVTNAADNLFPNSDYDCKNASGTSEIKWNHSTSTLTLSGSDARFYFDGNLTVGSSTTINYVGQGTLYFSGTVAFNGSSGVCGIANCTSSWNPDVNVLNDLV